MLLQQNFNQGFGSQASGGGGAGTGAAGGAGGGQAGANNQGFLNWMSQGAAEGQWPRPPPQQSQQPGGQPGQPQEKGFLKYD